MAITSITEESRGTSDQDGTVITARRVFKVISGANTDTTETARTATTATLSIPITGEFFPSSSALRARKIHVERHEDPLVYMVTVDYTNQLNLITPTPNPLSAPPRIRWTFATSGLPINEDVAGRAIVNSAGQSFDREVEVDIDDLVFTMTRNEAAWSPIFAMQMMGRVNQLSFLLRNFLINPGVARLRDFSASEENSSGVDYFEVNYVIHFRADGWLRSILDEGYVQIDPANPTSPTQRLVIFDANGAPLNTPVALNGFGLPGNPATPTFLDFQVYREANFNQLLLP